MEHKKTFFGFTNILDAQKKPIVVSLDIHDSSSYMFSLNTITGEIMKDTNIVGTYKKTRKHLKNLGIKGKILILIEAGPHGFAPYRYFTKLGYTVKMIAPSSIPKKGKGKKTDRDDAINNLHYSLTSGLLRYINIPKEEDECARECMRVRQNTVYQITKVKQKIISLLKRQGVIYNLTKTNWTKTYYKWLDQVKLPYMIREVIDSHLSHIKLFEKDKERLWRNALSYIENHEEYWKFNIFYKFLPGIGPIGAVIMILEGADLNRFSHPKPLMSYTGLVPGKHQSGAKDPALRITKAGNKYMRTVLIGASKHYSDNRKLLSSKKLEVFPEILKEFLIRCQKRLSYRYRYLRNKGKHSNKVKTAVARELCGFFWEYVTKIIPEVDLTFLKKAA